MQLNLPVNSISHLIIIIYTDINECARNDGDCDDVCTNLQGSHQCSCVKGNLTLNQKDKQTCIGKCMGYNITHI